MGIAIKGNMIIGGENVAIAGLRPSGIAIQSNVAWKAKQWALLAQTIGHASGVGAGVSAPINTTGATIIVIGVGFSGTNSSSNIITDNQGNTFFKAAEYSATDPASSIWYCISPNTSTSHVFYVSIGYAGFVIMVFSGTHVLFDKSTTSVGIVGALSIQTTPITPTSVPSLFITCVNGTTGASPPTNGLSVDSGFTIVNGILGVPSNSYGTASAYKEQNQIVSVAPRWSVLTGGTFSTAMVNFIAG